MDDLTREDVLQVAADDADERAEQARRREQFGPQPPERWDFTVKQILAKSERGNPAYPPVTLVAANPLAAITKANEQVGYLPAGDEVYDVTDPWEETRRYRLHLRPELEPLDRPEEHAA